jgi:hypothetical protein
MPEQAVAGGANQEQGKEEHLKRQIQQNLWNLSQMSKERFTKFYDHNFPSFWKGSSQWIVEF